MKGLTVTQNFISPTEQDKAVNFCRQQFAENPRRQDDTVCDRFGYGAGITYRGNITNINGDIVSDTIPSVFEDIIDKLNLSNRPDSVYILRYKPGQKMFAHIDATTAGDIISMLSIFGEGKLVYTRAGEEDVLINTVPGTLVQMQDEARTMWHHEVLPVEEERICLVFRKVTKEI